MKIKLYKRKFINNYTVCFVDGAWLRPDPKYYRCVKNVFLSDEKAHKYFGPYIETGNVDISADYKRLIFGK